MNIVWIDGGLGNQMFQYALALKLESLGREVKIDVTKYAEHHVHNDFELDSVFGINCSFASVREIRRLGYRKANHLTELLKKTPFRKTTIYNHESFSYDPHVLELDGYYLEGYWQSEKYFVDIQDKIREVYTFPELTDNHHQELVKQMQSIRSVSVHIRRGDYLRFPKYQNICTLEYYQKAISYFQERFPEEVCFFIFTNDMIWAKKHFHGGKFYFVEGNTGKESYRDMQLMSLCSHNIIANSSFSWWGAWLNRNPEKIVVAPGKWENGAENSQRDIVPESWIRMKV